MRRFGPLLFFVLCISFAAAQQYPIVEVTAAGSQRYKSEEITAYTGLKQDLHKPVALTAVRAAAERLANSGVFANVSYKHVAGAGGMKVSFTLEDKPADQFLPAVFENVVWLKSDDLDRQLRKRMPLYRGDLPLNGGLIDEVAQAVSELLAERGIQAHVAGERFCRVDLNKCMMRFAVDNLQVVTKQLDVNGISAEMLAEVRTGAAHSLINQPYEHSVADPEFTRLIRHACLKRGLLKPQISAIDASPMTQPGNAVAVNLTSSVVPGPEYKFEGATWTGNQAFPVAQLEHGVHLYQHLPVDGARLEADLARLQADYSMSGYMYAQIKPRPQFDDAAGIVKYDFVVKEGPLLKMGKFEVSGFPDKVAADVQALWKLREGDPFNRSYIDLFFHERTIRDLFGGKKFVVEQSEGEQPNSLDVTVILCAPDGCKPSPDVLYQSR